MGDSDKRRADDRPPHAHDDLSGPAIEAIALEKPKKPA
jgi:hypothetical protein